MIFCMQRSRSACPTPRPIANESIKYHWPFHWGDTRRELGCSAAEKSLERKLGESQKRNFKFTNGKENVEVCDIYVLRLFFKSSNVGIIFLVFFQKCVMLKKC